MSAGKIIGIVLGVIALACIAVAVVVGIFFHHVSQDVEGVSVVVDAPKMVRMGDVFEVKVSVTNERGSKVLNLSDIDIGEKYLKGFLVERVSPKEKESMHVPIDDSQSYTFDAAIAAGETRVFVFTLRAERVGVFRGDLDVCEGMQFITSTVQTSVRAGKGGDVEAE